MSNVFHFVSAKAACPPQAGISTPTSVLSNQHSRKGGISAPLQPVSSKKGGRGHTCCRPVSEVYAAFYLIRKNSIRLFFARPSEVLFGAIEFSGPYPLA